MEYDLRQVALELCDTHPGITELYLFGSRRHRTRSPRSDVDILVRHDEYIRPSALLLFLRQRYPALDLFLIDGVGATSCINESHIEAVTFDSLIDMLRAVKFWSRDEGFLNADIDWTFSIRDALQFQATVLLDVLVPGSDSVLPLDLFNGTRGYLERVVEQINASYDSRLFDCCAVLCRRLLETLIIETYEAKGQAGDIKGHDGNFIMFSDLLSHIENETKFSLGRNVIAGLKAFKRIGDLSAHDRRFNAHRDDIDRIRDHLRVAAEALLYVSGLKK